MKDEAALQEMVRKATQLKLTGDYAGALSLRLELEQLHDKSNVSVEKRTANLNLIAFLAVHSGKLVEAERAARKCLGLYRPVTDAHNEKLSTYINMLACILAEEGRFEEAIANAEEAVVIFSDNHGENSTFVQYRRRDIERMRTKNTQQPYLDR